MYPDPDDVDAPGELLEDPPSRAVSWTMVIVGALFLAPFLLLVFARSPVFDPGATLSALFTVGWGVFLGAAFLVMGLRRLKKAREMDAEQSR